MLHTRYAYHNRFRYSLHRTPVLHLHQPSGLFRLGIIRVINSVDFATVIIWLAIFSIFPQFAVGMVALYRKLLRVDFVFFIRVILNYRSVLNYRLTVYTCSVQLLRWWLTAGDLRR